MCLKKMSLLGNQSENRKNSCNEVRDIETHLESLDLSAMSVEEVTTLFNPGITCVTPELYTVDFCNAVRCIHCIKEETQLNSDRSKAETVKACKSWFELLDKSMTNWYSDAINLIGDTELLYYYISSYDAISRCNKYNQFLRDANFSDFESAYTMLINVTLAYLYILRTVDSTVI